MMSRRNRKLTKKAARARREKVEPGGANTSDLIATAFRKISLNSTTDKGRHVRKEAVSRKMNGGPAHSPVFFFGNNQSKYHQTSPEGSEFPSIVFANDTPLEPVRNLKEHSSHHEENSVLVLRTPIRESNEGLSKNRNLTMSSSSIDSGVYSPRGSKRPSFEQANLDTPHYNLFTDHGATRKLMTEKVDQTPRKESNPSILVNRTESNKRLNRLSVDKEAFAELLEAATKLVQDAHPSVKEVESASRDGGCHFLRNSLQYFKRRKSEWDARLKPRGEQDDAAMRKMSAGSILQGSTMFPTGWSDVSAMSWSRRSSAACIICDQKRTAMDENVLPNVIIKTTMARTMQGKRRFSEVLKVYKPGDLPFTEVVVPKLHELKTPTELLQENRLREIVDDNMPKFVRYTNWGCLYAHLISNRLLDPDMREFMNSTASNQQKGNRFFGECLPSQGRLGYHRLLQCYKEEREHSGHEMLVELLEGGIGRRYTF